MQVTINEKNKMLEIWLTSADQQDETCIMQTELLVSHWHSKGWMPVIYRSGKEDLAELTSALLVTNRERDARRHVERVRLAKESAVLPMIEAASASGSGGINAGRTR